MADLLGSAQKYLVDKKTKKTPMLGDHGASTVKFISYISTIINNTGKPESQDERQKLSDDIISFLNQSTTVMIEEKGGDEETLAHAAARLDLPQVMTHLYNKLPHLISTADAFGQYPWHTAAICGSVEVLETLITLGFQIDCRVDNPRWTVLHLATLCNQAHVIEYLLDNSVVPVDDKDSFGRTPLFLAIMYRKKEAAYQLLAYGADQTEKSKLDITPMGLSSYFMPELTGYFLDEVLKCRMQRTGDEKDKPAEFLKFSQPTDLTIVLVSPRTMDIIVHPVITRLVRSVYIKNPRYFSVFLLWVLLDLLSCAFLCMTDRIEIPTLLKDKTSSPILELVLACVIWVAISAAYRVGKFFMVARFTYKFNHTTSAAMQLNNCNKKCTNTRLKQDHSDFLEFQKQLACTVLSRLWTEAFWTVIGTLARLTFLVLSGLGGIHNEYKYYTIFMATIVIFLENSFHDANDIFCIPNSVMISLLSMKKALGSFVELLPGIFMISIPYFLITLKFTYKNEHYFTNLPKYQEPPEGEDVNGGVAVGWSLLYLYKVMLTDDYQVDFFNNIHPVFFAVYHILIVFLLSLVIMNLIIAQTSQTYEEFVENSKAEILRHRIFTITLFGLYTRAECHLRGTQVEPGV